MDSVYSLEYLCFDFGQGGMGGWFRALLIYLFILSLTGEEVVSGTNNLLFSYLDAG